jgi:hypothetical protein
LATWRFPPEKSAGIVILEVGPRAAHAGIMGRLQDLLAVLGSQSVHGALWIVEPGRVRIHLAKGTE